METILLSHMMTILYVMSMMVVYLDLMLHELEYHIMLHIYEEVLTSQRRRAGRKMKQVQYNSHLYKAIVGVRLQFLPILQTQSHIEFITKACHKYTFLDTRVYIKVFFFVYRRMAASYYLCLT